MGWVVQSSAVDYLHLLLVAADHQMDVMGIKERRFVISIHDEVRYLVREEQAKEAALALQTANLLVRAMFCHKLNMKGMPLDVAFFRRNCVQLPYLAFFSSVDVNKVIRKEPFMECVTPSNPQGLSHGYGVPLGKALTIKDLI